MFVLDTRNEVGLWPKSEASASSLVFSKWTNPSPCAGCFSSIFLFNIIMCLQTSFFLGRHQCLPKKRIIMCNIIALLFMKYEQKVGGSLPFVNNATLGNVGSALFSEDKCSLKSVTHACKINGFVIDVIISIFRLLIIFGMCAVCQWCLQFKGVMNCPDVVLPVSGRLLSRKMSNFLLFLYFLSRFTVHSRTATHEFTNSTSKIKIR